MSQTVSNKVAEAEIRAALDSWAKDVCTRDVKKILSHYASDVVAFDAVGTLQFKGIEAYGKHWAACMEMCPGTMAFNIDQVNTTAEKDIAFSHFLVNCGGTDQDGNMKTSWMRGTSCHRRENGQWRIAHEHFSAPFDMESCKAQFDLEP